MFSRYILYHLTIYAGLLWHTHIKPRTTSLQSNLQSWWRRLWRKSQTQSNFSNSTSTFNSDPGETIELPRTGDEAVKRLLACRDKDLYSILGVARNSTEEEIKKHYKKQAMLVHPDKVTSQSHVLVTYITHSCACARTTHAHAIICILIRSHLLYRIKILVQRKHSKYWHKLLRLLEMRRRESSMTA
jgi:hypothetical protein